MVRVNLPYVTVDRGRWYVRARKWRRKIRIYEEPGSPKFFERYYEAIAELEAEREAGAGREKDPSSLRWLVEKYYQSHAFKRLAPDTRKNRRYILERTCDRNGDGAKPFRRLEAKHIRARREELADRPDSANGYLRALRGVFRWAVDVGHLDSNPTSHVSFVKTKSDGHHVWTEAEVEIFERRHPIGTQSRLALALLLYTGVRRGDVIRLGRQMIRNSWLTLTVAKTKTELSIPVLPDLQRVIDATPGEHLTFLTTPQGKPYTAGSFGHAFRRWCDEAGLSHCSAHGLRKAGATRAAEAGATEHQLMAMFSWTSPRQASVYTRTASRKRLAGEGMALVAQRRASTDGDNVSHIPQVNGNRGKN